MNRNPSDRNDAGRPAGNSNPALPDRRVKLVHEMLSCTAHLQREMNRVCRECGLKQQQFSVLNEIVCHGPMSQKDVGSRLCLEKSNISKIVGVLLDRGLVTAAPDPQDRRVTLLLETGEGRRLWEDCGIRVNALFSDLLSAFSPEDAGDLLAWLRILRKNIGSR